MRGAELPEGPGQVEHLKSLHPAMRAAGLLQAGVSAPSVRRHGGTRLHAGSDAAHKVLPAGIRNVARARIRPILPSCTSPASTTGAESAMLDQMWFA